MLAETREKLRAAGTALNPQTLALTQAVFAAEAASPAHGKISIHRDHAYGPHERHRLNTFAPENAQGAPILVFVHGGGFARGDKNVPNTPYFDNVGLCFAQRGFFTATMTYRLAPDYVWPSGGEDVARAVAWLAENAARFGADPEKLFLMGTSAGATHVATCIAKNMARPKAGAILVSGIYDPHAPDIGPHGSVYFGAAPTPDCSIVDSLARSGTPLILTMAEFDPPEFRAQTNILTAAIGSGSGAAQLLELYGHNHFSGVLHLNGPDRWFADQIESFVRRTAMP